jgi:spore coat protein U-like protein
MRKHTIASIAAGVVLALAGTAQAAGSKTSTFQVNASVASNCVISTTNLAFGAYSGAADLTGSSNIDVRCTKNSPFTLSLSAGSTVGGSYAQRLLTDGAGNTLQYNLYTAGTYATVWGDSTAGTSTVGGTGLGLAAGNTVTKVVYGKLPDNATNQDAPVGAYTDSIVATITY